MALLLLTSVPVQPARGLGAYAEKLQVYVAGSNALWYMTFDGIDGSAKLASLESAPGLSWYNITAIKTSNWQSDFQIFGRHGYNLLPAPSTPSEGLFLTVGSDSYAGASAAAGALDSYLLSAFVSSANGTGTYSYYSPLSFNSVVPKTLLTFVPTKAGGFANAISPSAFDSTGSPMVVLEGRKSSSGFAHTLVVGSITNKALDNLNRPDLLGYFGSAVGSLQASNHSSSSTIKVMFLDGIVRSHDPAIITNDTARFYGSYALSLEAGKKVTKLNATVLQQPFALLATRSVDAGVLRTGDNLSVTVSFTNLSSAGPLTGLNFTDDWWKPSGLFKLVSNTTFPKSISVGSTVTPVYVLQYNGSVTRRITIPGEIVRYSFLVGGSSFQGRSVLNPVPLSLGADDAVVFTYVTATGGFGKSVGATQNFTVVAKNVGTFPASSVTVAGKSVAGLADHGGSASVQVSQSAQGFLGVNLTMAYSVTYKNPNGVLYNSTTNILQHIFSHTSMRVGYPSLVVTETLVPLANGAVNLTLTFTTSNKGSANVTSFVANGTLPGGLGCGLVDGKGIACSSGRLSLNYSSIQASAANKDYLKLNVTSKENFLFAALAYQAVTSGNDLTGMSNALGVPTGLVMLKQFSPSQLFGGMTSKVNVVAMNNGPRFSIYNATVSSAADSFDTITSSVATSKTSHAIAPKENVSFSYAVKASSAFGDLSSSNILANFYFAGTFFSTHASGPKVTIYQPLSATITTTPTSPTEGKSFIIKFSIANPSGVDVSNVLLTLHVPKGLALSQLLNASMEGGILSVSSSSLTSHRTLNASAVGVASSGITVPFDKATLTFSYGGTTINGKLPPRGIAIGEDITSRYLIPIGLVLLALLATAFYVRRRALPTAPASQK